MSLTNSPPPFADGLVDQQPDSAEKRFREKIKRGSRDGRR